MDGRQFASKVAIVTGAASGIGKSIATKLAAFGAAVVVADIDEACGSATVAQIIADGGRATFVAMDLGRFSDVTHSVDVAVQNYGAVDILVNCAAMVGARKPISHLSLADWQKDLDVNLTGPFLLTQAALRQMLEQPQKGVIVNILAIQANIPLPNRSAYAACKAAMGSLTRSLAVEFAERGIRANGIAVASVYTDSVKSTLRVDESESAQPLSAPPTLDHAAATLLGRMGRPEEIADLAVYLASEEASFLAGTTIFADGGRTLSRKADPFLAEELRIQQRQ